MKKTLAGGACLLAITLIACGGGGGSNTTPNTNSSPSEYGNYSLLMGSFNSTVRVSNLTAILPDECDRASSWCVTIDSTSEAKTSEDTPIYTGRTVSNDENNGRSVAMGYYPSHPWYVMTEVDQSSSWDYAAFTIDSSGALSGIFCWGFSSLDDMCYNLAAGSVHTGLGVWPGQITWREMGVMKIGDINGGDELLKEVNAIRTRLQK